MGRFVKIAVFGAEGQMGKSLREQIEKASDLDLAATLDRDSDLKILAEAKPDAVIDFSSPEGAVKISRWCGENGVALVSGTTGLNREQSDALHAAAGKTAVLVSPNMSPGINAMAAALKTFLENFIEGDVAVEETHHTKKKDAPSGTAKFLQALINESASKKVRVAEPVSFREGDVFGIHKIKFSAEGENVTLEHVATDRRVFARGAVLAARWLVKQPKGFYEMRDFLKGAR